VLRLDDNALSCLPSNIGSLSRLTELVVTKNDIEVCASFSMIGKKLSTDRGSYM
jgi:hypothetical protein